MIPRQWGYNGGRGLQYGFQRRLQHAEEENERLKEACAQFSKNETIFIREEARRTRERDEALARLSAAEEAYDKQGEKLFEAQNEVTLLKENLADADRYLTEDKARLSAAESERDQLRADRRNWPCHPAEELQARLSAAQAIIEERGIALTEAREENERVTANAHRDAAELAEAGAIAGEHAARADDLQARLSAAEEDRDAITRHGMKLEAQLKRAEAVVEAAKLVDSWTRRGERPGHPVLQGLEAAIRQYEEGK